MNLPPGPDLPSSRQSARWIARPLRFLGELRERHGDVFTMRLLREPPWVVVSDPELVRQVFTAPADVLHAGEPKRMLEPVLGPSSVLLEDEQRHVSRRRLLLPAFHGDRLQGYEEAMREIARAEIAAWPNGAGAAMPRLSTIALRVILRTVFGVDEEDGGSGSRMRDALRELLGYAADTRGARVALAESGRLAERRFAELRRLLDRADRLVLEAISRRRAASGLERRDDVLSHLLLARHEDGSPVSEGELRDQLMTLVVAGHDTTATSLAWALERLVRNPEALRRVTDEAEAGGGPYTDATVKETLRVRPVFMVAPRLAVRRFRCGDITVPAGVVVTPAIPLVHTRPDVYPDPEAFRPERFIDRPPGTYSWIPFGGGVRRCLGAGFAQLQMRVVLSTLLSRARLRAARAEPEKMVRELLVMAPSDRARLVLERRR